MSVQPDENKYQVDDRGKTKTPNTNCQASDFQSIQVEFKRLSATPLRTLEATDKERKDMSKAQGTPPRVPQPEPRGVRLFYSKHFLAEWRICLTCMNEVSGLQRYVIHPPQGSNLQQKKPKKKQPLNRKETVIIASDFISSFHSLAPAIHGSAY